jgi:hypothetical protein
LIEPKPAGRATSRARPAETRGALALDNSYLPPAPDFAGEVRESKPTTRPTSGTVFGILNIVFGSLGLACTPFAMLMFFIPPPPQGQNPAIDLMLTSQPYRTATFALGGVGMIACAIEIVAGIGLLKLRPWGRTLSIGIGIYGLLAIAASLVVNWIYYLSPLLEKARQLNTPEATGAVAGAIFGMVSTGAGVIYPALLLIFMMRPRLVEAYAPRPDSDLF